MAFGAEMKDFIAGFQTGYNMFKSKDEKEWEKEQRQMKRDQHQWGFEDRDFRKDQWDYNKSRDAESDRRWGVEDSWRREEAGRRDEKWESDQEYRERDYKLRENDLKLRRAKEQGAIPDPSQLPDVPSPYEEDTEGGVDETTTNSIKPVSYRGEPRSGPAVARRMVEDLNRDFGMPKEIAAGVVGQLAAESGGFETLQEINPTVPGSRGGFGYAQWTGPRRKQFERYAKENGLDPKSYAANYGFFKHELQNTSEGRILRDLRKARSATEAGRIFTGSAESGRGFLRPGIVNQKGRDNWTKRIMRLYGGSLNAARGGLVTALPEEDDELLNEDVMMADTMAAEEEEAPVETALPEEGPIPQPRYDGGMEGSEDPPTNDPYEIGRRSIRDGLNRAAKKSGMDIDAAIDDPELEKMRQNYLRGYGATPAGTMKMVFDKIDPDRKMPAAERNMMAAATVYKYYMDRGEVEQAQEAAASMVQYYRRSFQQFSALARAAIQEGDLDKAQKAAIAAYANIPNGRDLSVKKLENGQFEISVTDMKTGDQITRKVMDPKEFGALAMNFSPATFEDEILAAAGAPEPERKNASLEGVQKTGDSVQEAIEGDEFLQTEYDAPQLRQISQIATDIGAVEGNQMTGASATDFVSELLRQNQDDPTDDTPPYKVEQVRGGKIVRVTDRRGMTVEMSPNAFKNLEALRAFRQGKRAKEYEESQKPGYVSGVVKSAGKLMGAIGDNLSTVAPGEAIPTGPSMDTEEIGRLQDEEQRLRYEGAQDGDPEIQRIQDRLRELGAYEERQYESRAPSPSAPEEEGEPANTREVENTKAQIQRLRKQGVKMSDPRIKDLLYKLQSLGGTL